MNTPLVGPELLSAVREIGPALKSDIVKACGYVSEKPDGTQRINFIAFYEALLAAKGFGLPTNHMPGRSHKRGKPPSYTTTVHSTGNIVVGKSYVDLLRANPGDEFEIKVTKSGIRLIPAGILPEDHMEDE